MKRQVNTKPVEQVTTRQAADLLGLTVREIQRKIQEGQLPAVKFGRDWVLSLLDVEAARSLPSKPWKRVQH